MEMNIKSFLDQPLITVEKLYSKGENEKMLKVGVLGIGNAGNQVVAETVAVDKTISVFAINSSESDLNTLPDSIPKMVIGKGRGSGKNRDESKKYLAAEIETVVAHEDVKNFLLPLDLLFIVSSAGGGTGSGISLMLSQILKKIYPTVFSIPVSIFPVLKESLSAHANTLEYTEELYEKIDSPTYMMYDNEKYAHMPTNLMMEAVNKRIVRDIIVLSGFYNYTTKYASIDDHDMLNLNKTPGRTVVLSLPEFKEKDLDNTSVEKLLLQDLSDGPHVNLQKDRIINRMGVIANINTYISEQFDTSGSGLQDIVGCPIENFEHLSINEDRKLPNSVYVILCGCSKVNDRIRRINDRVEEIMTLKKQTEEEDDALSEYKGAELNSMRSYNNQNIQKGPVELSSILSAFMGGDDDEA